MEVCSLDMIFSQGLPDHMVFCREGVVFPTDRTGIFDKQSEATYFCDYESLTLNC